MNDRLREIPRVRQPADPRLRRRWFVSEGADLFVWESDDGVERFELSVDKPRAEHAWHWSRDEGLTHWRIDDGEASPLANHAPLAIRDDGPFDPEAAALAFEALGAGIDAPTYRVIMQALWRAASRQPA